MRYRLAWIWNVVWGMPQTLIGLVLLLALRGRRSHHLFRAALVTEWDLDSGLSMGPFIFVPRGCPRGLMVHEYGHCLQSLILGPLYLLVIVVPSLFWAGVPSCRRFRARNNYSYYRLYPERWANLLTSRVTGERPMGWYDRL